MPSAKLPLVVVARLLSVCLVALLGACSSEDDGSGPSGPEACPAGSTADAAGRCVPNACGPGQRKDEEAGGACKTLGWQACPAGFVADASGHGCRDVMPTATCGAGTMPVLGKTTCQPVGPATCAAGFEADPSGWGCRAVLPTAACTGATKATLGAKACAPVGDCGATFPPAGSTVFVDAAFTAGQLDATHVRTITEALAVAAANGVIAVAAGTYTESLAPTRSVRIVGRCAAQVTLASDGALTAGVAASGGIEVTVEGMTLSGHLRAAIAGTKASLTLRDVVLEANRGGGVLAAGTGTRATVERSVIRGSVAGTPGRGMGIEASGGIDLVVRDTTVTDNLDTGILVVGSTSKVLIERSAVLGTRANAAGDFGLGVMIRDGAQGQVRSSTFHRNREAGLATFGKGTRTTASDIVVSDTLASPASTFGWGLLVDTGAVEVERATITGSTDAGIHVEAGGAATARQTVVRATTTAPDRPSGYGVALTTRGTAVLEASAVVGNEALGIGLTGREAKVTLDGTFVGGTVADGDGERGFAMQVELGATAEVRGSALVGNAETAVYVTDPTTQVAIERTIISDTKAGKEKNLGRALVVEKGGSASVLQSAFVGNRDIGVSARGAGNVVTLRQTVIRGTLPRDSDGTHGRGIEANDGAKISLTECSLLENRGAAVVGTSKSEIDVRDSWIADTLPDASPGGPGRAVTVQTEARGTFLGVVVQRSTQIAIVAAASAFLSVKSSLLEETKTTDDGGFGHGILVFDGAFLVTDDVTLTRSQGAALLFSAARGTINATRVTGNAVGIHAQDGTSFREVAVVSEDPGENVVDVSSTSTFDGNETRVGAGALPLPVPLK